MLIYKLINRSATMFLALSIVVVLSAPARARLIDRSQHAPRAVIPSTAFNFGDIYRGEIISQIFIIKNDGDAELTLNDFKAGCGCEVTSWDKSVLPGKVGKVTLEVQTSSQSGAIAKIATLYTNDPERPTIIFTLSANVLNGVPLRQGRYIGPVFISPESRAVLYAGPGKKASTEFLITAENAPLKLLRVEGGATHFVSRVEAVEPGRRYKIIVESLPTEKPDLYLDQLRVMTDSESLPVFTINLVLRVYSGQ